MRFINRTQNTIVLEDIKKSIPFEKDIEQNISVEEAMASDAFRTMILNGGFKITYIGKTLFEKNLLRLQEEKAMKEYIVPQDKKELLEDSSELEVKIRGHFYEAGGYAKVNRNLAIGLNKAGVKVKIESISNRVNNLTEEELEKILSLNNSVSRKAIVIDSIIPTFTQTTSGRYKILYTTIEGSTIPDQFLEICNLYNEVWVTSNFCKKVLHEKGYKKNIFVFPPSLDINLYNEKAEPYKFNPELNKFVFVGVFSWGYRKGCDALLKSYIQEFNGNDDVSLLLLTRVQSGKNDIIKNDIHNIIQEYNPDNPPHIVRYSNVIPENIMPRIYKSCNAYVTSTRGEGFCLPVCEASLCGLPVIATNISGHTMFLKNFNSFLVDIDQLIKIPSGTTNVHYWDNQLFPSLTSKDFIKKYGDTMRYVYNNYKEAKEKNNILKDFIKNTYNNDNISNAIKNRLENIWRNL